MSRWPRTAGRSPGRRRAGRSPPVEERRRLRGAVQGDAGTRAGAELDPRGRGSPDERHDVGFDLVDLTAGRRRAGQRCRPRRRRDARRAGRRRPGTAGDPALRLGVGVSDPEPDEEPVELRLGQGERALVLDRVLGGQHDERVGQATGGALDRDLALLHRLEERRLRARRGPVDLVDEQDVREHGTRHEAEAPGPLVEDARAGHVARQQVGRALEPAEARPRARAKARARSVFPMPGTSSMSAWPSARSATISSRSAVGPDDGRPRTASRRLGRRARRRPVGPGSDGRRRRCRIRAGHAWPPRRCARVALGYVPGRTARSLAGTPRRWHNAADGGPGASPARARVRAARLQSACAAAAARPHRQPDRGRAEPRRRCRGPFRPRRLGGAGGGGPPAAGGLPRNEAVDPAARRGRPPAARRPASRRGLPGDRGVAARQTSLKAGSTRSSPAIAPRAAAPSSSTRSSGRPPRRRAPRPVRKHYRCTVCRDQLGGGEQRHGRSTSRTSRVSRRSTARRRPGAPCATGSRPSTANAALVEQLLDLHTPRQLVGL